MTEDFSPYRQYHILPFPAVITPLKCISSGAKILYSLLASFEGGKGYCFPSQEQLSEKMGVSRMQVSRNLKELKNEGFIRVVNPKGEEIKKGYRNKYYFLKHEVFDPMTVTPMTQSSVTEVLQSDVTDMLHTNNRDSCIENHDDSIKNNTMRNGSFRDRMGSQSSSPHDAEQKQTPVESKKQRTPPDHIKELLLLYYEDYGIKSMPQAGTKQMGKDIERIKMALNGTLFKGHVGFDTFNRKFTIDEIKLAIDRHALSFDPEYHPANKNHLVVYLEHFLFSPYSKVFQSWFLHHLQNEPNHIPAQASVGNRGVQAIVKKLIEYLGKPKTQTDADKLVTASYKINEWFKDPKKQRYWTPLWDRSFPGMVDIVWKAVKEEVNGSMPVTAGFFISKKTFDERLPDYCTATGVLRSNWRQ